jgi:hypothetical protein
MTNQFIEPLKTFLEITRENLKWVASEIQHQYFLSTLRDIEKKYPELHTEVEAFIEHLDAIFYDIDEVPLDCPDFVEAPEFETEAETDAFKFIEMKQDISDEGLNEPDYPYDTEPSA